MIPGLGPLSALAGSEPSPDGSSYSNAAQHALCGHGWARCHGQTVSGGDRCVPKTRSPSMQMLGRILVIGRLDPRGIGPKAFQPHRVLPRTYSPTECRTGTEACTIPSYALPSQDRAPSAPCLATNLAGAGVETWSCHMSPFPVPDAEQRSCKLTPARQLFLDVLVAFLTADIGLIPASRGRTNGRVAPGIIFKGLAQPHGNATRSSA